MRVRTCRNLENAMPKTNPPKRNKTKHLEEGKNKTTLPKNEKSLPTAAGRSSHHHTCNICKKSFSYSNDLRKHLRIHSDERPFECKQCGMRFRQAGCLKNHVACQHGSAVSFICHYCTKEFPIKERLRLHMRIHSGEKPYKCEYCAKGFSRGGQITQHLATHNACKKKHLAKALRSSKQILRRRMENVNRNACHFCNKRFRLLKKHLDECSLRQPETTFYCPDCKKEVTGYREAHLKFHLAAAKENQSEASISCGVCGSTFAQLSQLKVHSRVHSGERPYKCQVCWQSFAHSSVLKLHIRKHTGEKPFRCTVCPDTWFSQLPHLKTHMRTIHGMDKTYQCLTCQDFFKTKNEHQLHTSRCSQSSTSSSSSSSSGLPSPPSSSGGLSPTNSTTSLNTAISHLPKINQKNDGCDAALSRMRLQIAVLLKRISSEERLKQLGFEKILIDNVILGALKKAGRLFESEPSLPEIERFRRNIRHFLEWTLPKSMLEKFGFDNQQLDSNVDQLLVDLTAKLTSSCNGDKDQQGTIKPPKANRF